MKRRRQSEWGGGATRARRSAPLPPWLTRDGSLFARLVHAQIGGPRAAARGAGAVLARGAADGQLRGVCEAQLAPLAELPPDSHADAVVELEYGPAGTLLALCMTGVYRVDARAAGRPMAGAVAGAGTSCATSAAFVNDNVFAVSSDDGNLAVVDLRRPDKAMLTLADAHSDMAKNVAYLGNGSLLSSGFDERARVWDVRAEVDPHRARAGGLEHGATLFHRPGLYRTIVSPAKDQLLVFTARESVAVHRMSVGPELQERLAGIFTLNDQLNAHVAASDRDLELALRDLAARDRTRNACELMRLEHFAFVFSGRFDQQGRRAAVRGPFRARERRDGREVTAVLDMDADLRPGRRKVEVEPWMERLIPPNRVLGFVVAKAQLADFIKTPALSADGLVLATPQNSAVSLYRVPGQLERTQVLNTALLASTPRAHDGVLSCALDPHTPQLATCTTGGALRLYEVRS